MYVVLLLLLRKARKARRVDCGLWIVDVLLVGEGGREGGGMDGIYGSGMEMAFPFGRRWEGWMDGWMVLGMDGWMVGGSGGVGE
jgi:hypothetical protein